MGEDRKSLFSRLKLMLLAVGPGLFCTGYTIGTGSVTSMIKSGSMFGTQLLWVLALSSFFSWVLMEAYGRYAIVSGDTAIHGFRTRLKGGRFWAVLVIIGVVLGQWSCLSGILTITSNALVEMIAMFIPGVSGMNAYWMVLGGALIIVGIVYFLLFNGEYRTFEKILTVLVTFMGLSFVISMFIRLPDPSEIASGFIPSLPNSADAKLFVAAFVGTTMAAPTFVVRPLLLKKKGWTAADSRTQTRDSLTSAIVLFVISAAIMITATSVLFAEGKSVEKVLDMVYVLEPIAGRWAVALFILGLMSAGLSSIFPILMVAPLLIGDYREGEFRTKSRTFRILTAVAALVGLTVPICGSNPILAQVATQVANVFVLPLVIILMMILVNRRSVMGDRKAGVLLNAGMGLAFVFACVVAYTGVLALMDLLMKL